MTQNSISLIFVAVAALALQGCGGGGGSSGSVPTSPPTPTPPTATLSASASDVRLNGTITLTWSSTNATACTASGDWSGSLGTSGSQSVTVSKQTPNLALSCTGAGGTVNALPASVKGWDSPTVTVSASPTTVLIGGTPTVSWSSTNANACTATAGLTGTIATSGSQAASALTAAGTYTVQCTNPAYTTAIAATTTVAVQSTYSLTVTALAESPGPKIVDPVSRYYVPDWAHPVQSAVPYVWIELQDSTGKPVAGSYANSAGAVTFSSLDPKQVYIPTLRSKLLNQNGFDLWIVNNTKPINTAATLFRSRYATYEDRGPAYVPDKSKTSQSVAFVAPLGWDAVTGKLIDSARVSGPYVTLKKLYFEDSIIQSAAGGSAAKNTGPLTVLWSVINNKAGAGVSDNFDKGVAGPSRGFAGQRHCGYDASGNDTNVGCVSDPYFYVVGSQLYALTELSEATIYHEFFHFVQNDRLRFFYPGGSHDSQGYYDNNLAYSEGLADSLPELICSCSSPQSIDYYSSVGQLVAGSAYGDFANPDPKAPVGWFQEASIARLVWALLDPSGQFKLSPSEILAPLFTTAETTSRYMPTIWSYGKQFKLLKPSLATALNSLGATLNIDFTANDEYGTNESHLGNVSSQDSLPIFTNLAPGGSARVCTTGAPEDNNKLGNARYLKVSVPQAGYHQFSISGPVGALPWFTYQWTENNNYGYRYPQSASNSFSHSIAVAAGDSVFIVGDCSVNNSKSSCKATADPPVEQCWTISLQ